MKKCDLGVQNVRADDKKIFRVDVGFSVCKAPVGHHRNRRSTSVSTVAGKRPRGGNMPRAHKKSGAVMLRAIS